MTPSPRMAVDVPAVEQQVAFDLVRRAFPIVPVVVVMASLPWGIDGALSAAYAFVIVLANLLLSAVLLSRAARVSLTMLMAAALGGYLVRLALVAAAVLSVKDAAWVSLWPLCLTLVAAHLGLLLWEMQFVSASLAYPGLKPRKDR